MRLPACLALLCSAGATGFVLSPSALHRSAGAPATLLSRRVGTKAPLPGAARCRRPASAVALAGSDSMDELLKAAAETREKLQASGGEQAETGEMMPLAALAGDRGQGGAGPPMRDVFEGYGAAVEVDVYAAPEPVFKMLPKLADRTALRVASFSDTPMPASAVCEVAASGVGLADFSHHGVIAVSGADRYRFVNGLCTNKVLDAKPGQALKSCFTNKLGRSVDLTTLAVLQDSILIICSANRLQHLYQSLDALIFPKDDVQIEDLTPSLAQFRLVGPKAAAVATSASGDQGALPGAGWASAWGSAGLIIHGCGLASPGYTMLVPVAGAAAAWKNLAAAVAAVCGMWVEPVSCLWVKPMSGAIVLPDAC